MRVANLGYRRIYLKQMNKINKLSHLSSKSDKLHPPRNWGSWSGEFCLPEKLATLAGCCQRQSPPHGGYTLPSPRSLLTKGSHTTQQSEARA